MENEIHSTPKYGRLFLKTYLSFAAVTVVFAILLGVLYMRLYESATIENFETQLTEKAERISDRCSGYFFSGASTEWMEYLILIGEEGTEVWSVYNPNAINPLGTDMAIGLDLSALSTEYVEIAEIAFSGKNEIRTKYSDYHDCTMVTVGVPVTGINGEVAGAVLSYFVQTESQGQMQ